LALAQTEADANRLRVAGVQRIEVCGNLKFDMRPEPTMLALGQSWRAASMRPVVLAASTREGEEAELLRAWCKPVAGGPGAQAVPRLFMVPRHPQRFDEVARLIEQAGLSMARRSSWAGSGQAGGGLDAAALAADVWLGDSMGEMPAYYAAADVALLGGSFAPLGGQNLIEAAACACPLIMGPSTFNFEHAAELALACGAARRVDDAEQGVQAALGLLAHDDERQTMVQAARSFSAQHRGAANRMAHAILSWMN
jgi:3-deoxy-D-manno-octulosonic-acid transferase